MASGAPGWSHGGGETETGLKCRHKDPPANMPRWLWTRFVIKSEEALRVLRALKDIRSTVESDTKAWQLFIKMSTTGSVWEMCTEFHTTLVGHASMPTGTTEATKLIFLKLIKSWVALPERWAIQQKWSATEAGTIQAAAECWRAALSLGQVLDEAAEDTSAPPWYVEHPLPLLAAMWGLA
jgi:hypothetical protein